MGCVCNTNTAYPKVKFRQGILALMSKAYWGQTLETGPVITLSQPPAELPPSSTFVFE